MTPGPHDHRPATGAIAASRRIGTMLYGKAVSTRGDLPREPGFVRVDGCELCRAARISRWYWEDEICWIAECEICEVPMVVWRSHGTEPPAEQVAHMRERLREVAAAQLGEFWVDAHMRNIPDHYHAHARPDGGFFGYGSRRRMAP